MKRRTKIFISILLVVLAGLATPEFLHQNSGKSRATGSPGKGSIENAWLVPYFGTNYRYFSPLSYYILNRSYAHHRVHNAILEAYATCETTCPDVLFRLMECGNKYGGKLLQATAANSRPHAAAALWS